MLQYKRIKNKKNYIYNVIIIIKRVTSWTFEKKENIIKGNEKKIISK